MKKLLTLCLVLFATVSMQAQSIVGQWATILEEGEQNVALLLGFDSNKDAIMKILIEMYDKELGTMNFSVTVEGKYKVKGDQLTLMLNKDKVDVEVGEIEWSAEMQKAIDENPATADMIINMMKAEMDKEKNTFVEDFEKKEEMTIISVTDTELILNSGDENMTFKKFEN